MARDRAAVRDPEQMHDRVPVRGPAVDSPVVARDQVRARSLAEIVPASAICQPQAVDPDRAPALVQAEVWLAAEHDRVPARDRVCDPVVDWPAAVGLRKMT